MTTLNLQVGANGDDGFHVEAQHDFSNYDPLILGRWDENNYGYEGWARFTAVTIGQSDTIDEAKLTLTGLDDYSGTVCQNKIEADDSDNAGAPANHTAYDAIVRTSASVDWNPTPACSSDVEISTPDFKSVVQEIVDREGWSSENAVLIIVGDASDLSDDEAMRQAYDYNSSSAKAPKLDIDYTGAGVTTRRYGLTVLGVG